MSTENQEERKENESKEEKKYKGWTDDDIITIAMPSRGFIPIEVFVSHMHIYKPKCHFISNNVVPLDKARNIMVAKYLVDNPNASHILFWDDDIIPPLDGIARLWRHNAPIVSGLYFQKHPPFRPVMGLRFPGEGLSIHLFIKWKENTTIKVDAVGMGFCLIRRDVLQSFGPPWFQFGQISEDFMFCKEAAEQGFQTLVDTSVKCSHRSERVFVDEDIFKMFQTREMEQAVQSPRDKYFRLARDADVRA